MHPLTQILIVALATDAVVIAWFHDRSDGNGLFQALRERLAYWEAGDDIPQVRHLDFVRYYIAAALLCALCLAYYGAAFVTLGWYVTWIQPAVLALAAARVTQFLHSYYERLTASRDVYRPDSGGAEPVRETPQYGPPGTFGGPDRAGLAPPTSDQTRY